MKLLGTVFALALAAMTACKSPPAPTVTVIGLWPEDPPLRYKPFNTWTGGNYYDWPRLDSTRPILLWEAFPRSADLGSDTNGLLRQFKFVTYDLRLWQGHGDYPSALVYSRDALPEALHQMEQPLARAAWYFWSIRARFEFHGRIRVTEWSRVQSPEPAGAGAHQEEVNYPDSRYYRFYIR